MNTEDASETQNNDLESWPCLPSDPRPEDFQVSKQSLITKRIYTVPDPTVDSASRTEKDDWEKVEKGPRSIAKYSSRERRLEPAQTASSM
jgi:hypothetical protein